MTLAAVETTQIDPVEEAFDESFEAGLFEDEIKMEMIKAGCSFKQIANVYNRLMVERGHIMDDKDKRDLVDASCKGKALGNEAVFAAVSSKLMSAIPNCTERSAGSLIRGYARRNGIKAWVAPEPERNGRQGFGRDYREYILEYVKQTGGVPTEEQAMDYIMGRNGAPETSESTRKSKSVHLATRNFAEALLNNFADRMNNTK